jgi:hypothetical protein
VTYNEHVVPVCLPNEKHVDYGRVEAVQNTFMVSDEWRIDTLNLSKVTTNMTLRSDNECRVHHDEWKLVSEASWRLRERFCHFDEYRSFQMALVDYGSPLVVKNKLEHKWYQISVASHNEGLNFVNFVRVSKYVKWIQETIENEYVQFIFSIDSNV